MISNIKRTLTILFCVLAGWLLGFAQDSQKQETTPIKYKYISRECWYLLSQPTDPPTNNPSAIEQLTWGDRLRLLGEKGDFYYLESYSGKRGYLRKDLVQDDDPKVYLSGTINGKKVVGFLRGPAHCSYISSLMMIIGDGELQVPISRITKVEIAGGALKILNDEGDEYIVERPPWSRWGSPGGEAPGRFIYGQLPSIKSGSGVELHLSPKIKQHLLFEKIKP